MLRIALGITILAGIGAIVLTFKVSEKITTITNERDTVAKEKADADTAKNAAVAEAKKEKNDADKAKKDLAAMKESHDKAVAEADTQTKRANTLNTQLIKATQEKTEAQQKLAAWDATQETPDRILRIKEDLRQSKETIEAYVAEKKILNRKITMLTDELAKYTGPEEKVLLPTGLKGKVLLSDQKNDFVILDIGGDQGVKERGEMLVSRAGRLVGKIRFTSVQPTRSIANVLPGSKQAEVMEGDIVLHE